MEDGFCWLEFTGYHWMKDRHRNGLVGDDVSHPEHLSILPTCPAACVDGLRREADWRRDAGVIRTSLPPLSRDESRYALRISDRSPSIIVTNSGGA